MPITEVTSRAGVRARLANLAQREAEASHAQRVLDRIAAQKRRQHDRDPAVQLYRAEKAKRERRVDPLLVQSQLAYRAEMDRMAEARKGGRPRTQRFEARDPVDRLLGSVGEWRGE